MQELEYSTVSKIDKIFLPTGSPKITIKILIMIIAADIMGRKIICNMDQPVNPHRM